MISNDYATYLTSLKWTHLATIRPYYKLNEINSESIGKNLLKSKKINKVFYVVEKDFNDNWYHMHLIMDSMYVTKAEILQRLGWNDSENTSKVVGYLQPIEDKKAVSSYCSKYIGKTALCHNFLIKNHERIKI